jgi:hypothetical protein
MEHPSPARSLPPGTAQPPHCATSRVASGSPVLRYCQGSGRSRAVCGAAGRRGHQDKASRSLKQVGGKATGSLMEEGRRNGQHKPAPRIPPGCKLC